MRQFARHCGPSALTACQLHAACLVYGSVADKALLAFRAVVSPCVNRPCDVT